LSKLDTSAIQNSGCPSVLCIYCEINEDGGTLRQTTYHSLFEAHYWVEYYLEKGINMYFAFRCKDCSESKRINIYHLCMKPEASKDLEKYI